MWPVSRYQRLVLAQRNCGTRVYNLAKYGPCKKTKGCSKGTNPCLNIQHTMIVINANHDAKQAACQCLSNPAGESITVVTTACSECKSCKEWCYFLQLGKKKKTLCYCFWASQGMSYCNPSISWNEQRRCECLQQGNGKRFWVDVHLCWRVSAYPKENSDVLWAPVGVVFTCL